MAKPTVAPSKFNQPKPAAGVAAAPQAAPAKPSASAPLQRPTTVPAAAPADSGPQRPAVKMELKPHTGQPTPQAVAEAAYFLWLQRGGNPTANWLEAEARLRLNRAERAG